MHCHSHIATATFFIAVTIIIILVNTAIFDIFTFIIYGRYAP